MSTPPDPDQNPGRAIALGPIRHPTAGMEPAREVNFQSGGCAETEHEAYGDVEAAFGDLRLNEREPC